MKSALAESLVRRAVRWFNEGRVPSAQQSFACPGCGLGVAAAQLYWRTDTPLGRIRQVYDRRTMRPVPRFYAVAAVVGLTVGGAATVVLRRADPDGGRRRELWPLWAGPLASVAGGWAVMTSSALRSPGNQVPSQ